MQILLAIFLTTIACLFVPRDPKIVSDLSISGIFLTLSILALVFRGNSGRAVMFRPYAIFLLATWLWVIYDLIFGVYYIDGFEKSVYQYSLILIGVFLICPVIFDRTSNREKLALVSLSGNKMLRKNAAMERAVYKYQSTVFFALFILAIFVYLYRANFDFHLIFESLTTTGRFNAPWSRGSLGDATAVLDHLSYFGYAMPVLYAFLFTKLSAVKKVIYLLMFLVFLMFVFHSGNRRLVASQLLILIACMAYFNRAWFSGRLLPLLGLVGLPFLMDYMLQTRNVGLSEAEYKGLEILSVDDIFLRLCELVTLIPDTFDYLYIEVLYFAVIRYIPRALWEGKPTALSFSLGEYNDINASLTMSAIGEGYLSFGVVGVIISALLFGALIAYAARLYRDLHLGLYTFGMYVLSCNLIILGVRSINEIFIQSFPIICFYLMAKLMAKHSSPTQSR